MFNKIFAHFANNTRTIEILDLLENNKQVVRQCFTEKELELVKLFCQDQNLHIYKSPLKLQLQDKDQLFSNKGKFKETGLNIIYISKDQKKAMLACLYELRQDHKQLGILLNYPNCCIDFFIQQSKTNLNPYHTPANPWTNITQRHKDYVLLSHFPCNNNCKQSIQIAKKRLQLIEKHNKEFAKEIIKKLNK